MSDSNINKQVSSQSLQQQPLLKVDKKVSFVQTVLQKLLRSLSFGKSSIKKNNDNNIVELSNASSPIHWGIDRVNQSDKQIDEIKTFVLEYFRDPVFSEQLVTEETLRNFFNEKKESFNFTFDFDSIIHHYMDNIVDQVQKMTQLKSDLNAYFHKDSSFSSNDLPDFIDRLMEMVPQDSTESKFLTHCKDSLDPKNPLKLLPSDTIQGDLLDKLHQIASPQNKTHFRDDELKDLKKTLGIKKEMSAISFSYSGVEENDKFSWFVKSFVDFFIPGSDSAFKMEHLDKSYESKANFGTYKAIVYECLPELEPASNWFFTPLNALGEAFKTPIRVALYPVTFLANLTTGISTGVYRKLFDDDTDFFNDTKFYDSFKNRGETRDQLVRYTLKICRNFRDITIKNGIKHLIDISRNFGFGQIDVQDQYDQYEQDLNQLNSIQLSTSNDPSIHIDYSIKQMTVDDLLKKNIELNQPISDEEKEDDADQPLLTKKLQIEQQIRNKIQELKVKKKNIYRDLEKKLTIDINIFRRQLANISSADNPITLIEKIEKKYHLLQKIVDENMNDFYEYIQLRDPSSSDKSSGSFDSRDDVRPPELVNDNASISSSSKSENILNQSYGMYKRFVSFFAPKTIQESKNEFISKKEMIENLGVGINKLRTFKFSSISEIAKDELNNNKSLSSDSKRFIESIQKNPEFFDLTLISEDLLELLKTQGVSKTLLEFIDHNRSLAYLRNKDMFITASCLFHASLQYATAFAVGTPVGAATASAVGYSGAQQVDKVFDKLVRPLHETMLGRSIKSFIGHDSTAHNNFNDQIDDYIDALHSAEFDFKHTIDTKEGLTLDQKKTLKNFIEEKTKINSIFRRQSFDDAKHSFENNDQNYYISLLQKIRMDKELMLFYQNGINEFLIKNDEIPEIIIKTVERALKANYSAGNGVADIMLVPKDLMFETLTTCISANFTLGEDLY